MLAISRENVKCGGINMKNKILSVILLVTLGCMATFALATEVQPRFSHVYSITTGIELNGSAVTCLGAGVSLYDDTYNYLSLTLLRCPQDGGNWSPVSSWSTTSTGITPMQIERVVSVQQGYDYKVYVNVQIKDETGYILESIGRYSQIVSYHTSE